jgi:hypothetical protein
LLALYWPQNGNGTNPASELVVAMSPRFWERIAGSTAWTIRTSPK